MISIEGITYSKFNFPCGEMHIKIDQLGSYLGSEVKWDFEKNEEILELALLLDALNNKGVEINNLALSYIPFSRQDRITSKEEPFSLKVFANFINSFNFKKVYVEDPHSDVSTALINNCYANQQHNTFINYFDKKRDFFLISPDGGALKKIYKLAELVDCADVIECSKYRDLKTGDITKTVIHYDDLQGKDCYVVDDICDGGRTFIEIAKVLRSKNSGKLTLMVTHGFFTKGLEVVSEHFDQIITKKGVVYAKESS